jgi:hypothetical protein
MNKRIGMRGWEGGKRDGEEEDRKEEEKRGRE